MDVPDSTLTGFESRQQQEVAAWGRRVVLALLLVLVLIGMSGWLGVRSTTTEATADGYELQVRHAAVARAGLDVPWRVTVRHPGGFADDVTLAVSGDYFDIYETQGFSPEPSESVRDGSTLYLTFTAPEGDEMTVDYDAYIQPSSQRGEQAEVSVVDADLQPLVSVEVSTALVP